MHCEEAIKIMKESIIFETAWLYTTLSQAKGQKDRMVEAITVVWNRSLGRAGISGDFYDMSIRKEDILCAAERWNSKEQKGFAVKDDSPQTKTMDA